MRDPTPDPVCSVSNCDAPVRASGLCSKHWQRRHRHGDPTIVHRSTPGPRRPPQPPAWLNVERLAATQPLPGWQRYGACTDRDPNWFHPPRAAQGSEQKQVCDRCPVRYACLAHQLQHSNDTHDWGIWGGTSARERRTIRRAVKAVRARGAAA